MTMTRQQQHAQERKEKKLKDRVAAFRLKNPMAEVTYQQGFEAGWHTGWEYTQKTSFAAAVLALHELEGYGGLRNLRFLRLMESIMINTLSSEEIIDEALEKGGVKIDFREPFPEERIQEA